jgi:hypothetical protein
MGIVGIRLAELPGKGSSGLEHLAPKANLAGGRRKTQHFFIPV